jgi:hypothetical protein
MPSLREKLNAVLPEVLPEDPNGAVSGTELIQILTEKGIAGDLSPETSSIFG